MPLKGSLRDFSLPDLFQLIHFGKKNGTLVIANGDSMGYVCFRNGNVFFATHNWKRPPLGERLVEAGMVAPEQIQEALELQATSRKDQRVGNILVELGYLKREALEVFVEEHIRDAVFNLLRWTEGDFDFDPDQIFPEEDIGLSMSTEDLIMEGSRRLEEWSRLEKKVPSLDAVFELTAEAEVGLSGMNLTAEERLVLDQVDGESSVRDIIDNSGQSALVTFKALYGLVTAKVITLTGPSAEPLPEEAGFEEAEQAEATEPEPAGVTEPETAGATEPVQESASEPEEVVIAEAPEGEFEDIIVEEVERPAARRRRRDRRKRFAAQEMISVGEETEEDILVEEVTADEAPARERRRRARPKAESKERPEEAVEEPGPVKAGPPEVKAAAEEEALEDAGAAEEVEAATEAAEEPAVEQPEEETLQPEAAREGEAEAMGAPAPGQSLVDYYKSLALKELGDSEVFRETEEKALKEEPGAAGPVDYSEEGFIGAVETADRPEFEQPEDIPMEWSGHLTRLAGSGGRRAVERTEPAAQELPEEPMPGEAASEEPSMETGLAPDEVPEAARGYMTIEQEMEAEALSGTQPVAEEYAAQEPAEELLPEQPVAEEYVAEEPVAGEPVAGEYEAGQAGYQEQEAALQGEIAEPGAVEPFQEEEPGESTAAGGGEAGEITEVPLMDEEVLPTEEEIERLLQVNPQPRSDLSREELLAFDQPTYPIVESREVFTPEEPAEEGGAPLETGGAVPGVPAAPPTAYDETAAGMGQVLQFGKAGVQPDVEVILEQPDPIVQQALTESISVAEDLGVPVFEVTGRATEVEEPSAEAAADQGYIPLVLEEEEALDSAALTEQDRYDETESVLEIIGLEEGAEAEVIPLDSARVSVAEELDLEAPPAVDELEQATAQAPDVLSAVADEAVYETDTEVAYEETTGEAAYDTAVGEVPQEAVEEAYVPEEAAAVEEQVPTEPGFITDSSYEKAEFQASEVETEQTAAITEASAESPGIAAWDTSGEMSAVEQQLLGEPATREVEEEYEETADAEADQGEQGFIMEEQADVTAVEQVEEAEEQETGESADFDEGPGLLGGIQVSGKRGAGTSLVDLETFELEQELLELAGGSQKKKRKIPITEKQAGEQEKKKKRGGKSKGKEVDKGSVKKIIDDLKGK